MFTLTLFEAKKGVVKIVKIPDDINRAKLTRLGVWEGATVTTENIPIGPTIVNDSICIGRNLAKRIEVTWTH